MFIWIGQKEDGNIAVAYTVQLPCCPSVFKGAYKQDGDHLLQHLIVIGQGE